MIRVGLEVKTMSWVQCLAAIVLITVGTGCNRTEGLAPVAGVVEYRGALLTQGQVVFTPQTGAPAVGAIGTDGKFAMQTAGRPGAAIGNHRVTVHSRRTLTDEEAQKLVVPESLIPDKYSQQDQSPLTFDVKTGPNEYRIELE